MKTPTIGILSHRQSQVTSPYAGRTSYGRIVLRKQSDQSFFNQHRQQFDVETLFKELQNKKEIINQLQQEVQQLKTKQLHQEVKYFDNQSQLQNYETTILEHEKIRTFDKFLTDGDYDGSLKTVVITLKRTVKEKERQIAKLFEELQGMKKNCKTIRILEQDKALLQQQKKINELIILINQRDNQIVELRNLIEDGENQEKLKNQLKNDIKREQETLESLKKQTLEMQKYTLPSQQQTTDITAECQSKKKQTREKRYQSQEFGLKKQNEEIKSFRKTSATEEAKQQTEQSDFIAFKQDLINQQFVNTENHQISSLQQQIDQLQKTITLQNQQQVTFVVEKNRLDQINIELKQEIQKLQDLKCKSENEILDLKEDLAILKTNDQIITILIISASNPKGKQMSIRFGSSLNNFYEQICSSGIYNIVPEKTNIFIPSKNMRYARTQWNTRFCDFTNIQELEQAIMIIELQQVE